jgi:hypothetical protein
MIQRHAKVATLIFLIAMCAFVMDVLSPATPTPTARAIDSLVIALLSLSFLAFLVRFLTHWDQSILNETDASATKPASRRLIALICTLLC